MDHGQNSIDISLVKIGYTDPHVYLSCTHLGQHTQTSPKRTALYSWGNTKTVGVIQTSIYYENMHGLRPTGFKNKNPLFSICEPWVKN